MFLVLVSAVQALPAYEYAKLALRWVNADNPVGWRDPVPYYVHQNFAFYPESLLGIVIPGFFRHTDPFTGLAALTLALVGIAASWEDRMTRLFGAIALGGLLFSLAHNSVFHGVLYALIPMVEKARNPSAAIFIFHFGLCVLIAYGVDGYRLLSSSIVKRTTAVLLGFAALLAIASWTLHVTRTSAEDRLGIVLLAAILLAAILTAWRNERISTSAAISSLTLLALLELGNVTTYSFPPRGNPNSLLKKLTDHYDIAAFLKDQYEPVRVEIDADELPYNFGDWYGIDHFGGYLASLTTNVARVQANTRVRMMYGVNFHVGRKPIRDDQVEEFASRSGLKVYRNPAAFPRAWAVHEVLTIKRDDQIGAMLTGKNFNPRRQTFIKGTAPELGKCDAQETAAVVDRRSDRVLIEANLKCRGMVIDSDTFYPGWVATVDGQPAAVYEAYGFLRGVVVEAGPHRIELRYRPKSVYWGAALTALGLVGAAALTLLTYVTLISLITFLSLRTHRATRISLIAFVSSVTLLSLKSL